VRTRATPAQVLPVEHALVTVRPRNEDIAMLAIELDALWDRVSRGDWLRH
jgi:hypothetical protein